MYAKLQYSNNRFLYCKTWDIRPNRICLNTKRWVAGDTDTVYKKNKLYFVTTRK